MLIEDRRVAAGLSLGLAVLMVASVAGANDIDRFAASTKTCESVINDNLKAEFPKAKSIAWNMDSASEYKSSESVKLVGQGNYKGATGESRTYDFECIYDIEMNRVVSAWWQSSFDNKRHAVVTGSLASASGPSESTITKACEEAVDNKVRHDFEHKIRSLGLIEDSIMRRSESHDYDLTGQGRFQGSGGHWHRFDFTCTFAADDDKVSNVTWKHVGDERDLDNESHAVVTGSPVSAIGPSEAKVIKACEEAVDNKVRHDFEHKIRSLGLIEDSIMRRSEPHVEYNLKGQGRFQGSAGDWHRFDFTCSFAADDDKVSNVTWKHVGDERHLDN